MLKDPRSLKVDSSGCSNPVQVKVCGLTRAKEAVQCAELGVQAIGLVFYPPSPRHVSVEQAREITGGLPDWVVTVGVFVDCQEDEILRVVEGCRLKAVQLHGQEPPELVERLRGEGLLVLKALFAGGRQPPIEARVRYRPSAFLVEGCGGPLPGGNALTWNWEAARQVAAQCPVVLAGGLDPDNVAAAIGQALPDAVDVSSGVEVAPGIKDLDKVRRFLEVVSRFGPVRPVRSIFRASDNLQLRAPGLYPSPSR